VVVLEVDPEIAEVDLGIAEVVLAFAEEVVLEIVVEEVVLEIVAEADLGIVGAVPRIVQVVVVLGTVLVEGVGPGIAVAVPVPVQEVEVGPEIAVDLETVLAEVAVPGPGHSDTAEG